MLPEPSRVMPVGLLSPVSGTWVVGALAECAAGTMRTRLPLSVTNISPLGSKAMPAGEFSAQVVTVESQGEMATGDAVPVPLRATCRTWLRFPSPIYRLAPALSTASACGKLTLWLPRFSRLGVYDA